MTSLEGKKKLHIILAFTLKHDSHANMSKDGDYQFLLILMALSRLLNDLSLDRFHY